MIARNTKLKPQTKPIPRRRKKPRRGPMRSPEYRAWIRSQSCVCWPRFICTPWAVCEAAHTENNGMRSKGPDSSCAPLCPKHHREYDSGRKAFELKYRVDMKAEAAKHYAQYLVENS